MCRTSTGIRSPVIYPWSIVGVEDGFFELEGEGIDERGGEFEIFNKLPEALASTGHGTRGGTYVG